LSASEFAFLAFGLMLGVASGAALMEVLRSRPPAPREVRVTVAHDSVPVRSSTLATDPFAIGTAGPAPFGPGDRRLVDRSAGRPSAAGAHPSDRTAVPSTGRAEAPLLPSGSPVEPLHSPVATDGRDMVGIAVTPEADGAYAALAAAEARAALVLGDPGDESVDPGAIRPTATAAQAGAAASVATLTAVVAADGPAHDPAAAGSGPQPESAERSAAPRTGPCAELHAIAEDRCAVAARSRSEAGAARDRLREAQRTYDDHQTRSDEAEGVADPRAVRLAKETAQHAFRTARDAAVDRGALEAAAAEWLEAVNRINAAARGFGLSYSRFIAGVQAAGIEIDRKALADIAVHDIAAFGAIAEKAKAALAAK